MAQSYFDKEKWKVLCEKSKSEWDCPNWLAQSLQLIGDNIDKFPVKEDEQRFVVEFIYPH